MLCYGGTHAKVASLLLFIAIILQAVSILTPYWLRLHGHEVEGGPKDNTSPDGTHYYGLYRYCWRSDNNTDDGEVCLFYLSDVNIGDKYKWWWPAAGMETLGLFLVIICTAVALLRTLMTSCQSPCVRLVPAIFSLIATFVLLTGCIVFGVGHHDMKFVGDMHLFASFYLAVVASVLCFVASVLLFLAPGRVPERATPVVQYSVVMGPAVTVISGGPSALSGPRGAHSAHSGPRGAPSAHSGPKGAPSVSTNYSRHSHASTQMTRLSEKSRNARSGYHNSAMS